VILGSFVFNCVRREDEVGKARQGEVGIRELVDSIPFNSGLSHAIHHQFL
jgi:hypothetical protein